VAVARDLYRQCVDLDPAFAPAWAKLGRCHRLLSKYYLERPEENLAQAEACFQRALELDPELTVAHKLYAHHESEMGHAREAMVRLLGLARSARNDPEIFAGLVHACRYSGLLEASEAAHREARRLDPHVWTSVVYTWWARGEMERIVGETSDASDFQLRLLALEALGRRDEALAALKAVPTASLAPVFASIRTGLRALLEEAPGAVEGFADTVATHTDPEAFFMYAALQAHFGDPERALARLTKAVDGGFTVPQALREHPWLSSLRSSPAFPGLVERAEARRSQALVAFRDAGGETLLGAL
jgi:tetratricopeptide (TPR) repeat protein